MDLPERQQRQGSQARHVEKRYFMGHSKGTQDIEQAQKAPYVRLVKSPLGFQIPRL